MRLSELDALTTERSEAANAAYLAWRDAKIRRVLSDKAAGVSRYKPLEEIAARYRAGRSD